MSLGLDLQGGSHLLLELNTAELMHDKLEGVLDVARSALRSEKLRYTGLGVKDGAVVASILGEAADREQARKVLRNAVPNADVTMDENGAVRLSYGEKARNNFV